MVRLDFFLMLKNSVLAFFSGFSQFLRYLRKQICGKCVQNFHYHVRAILLTKKQIFIIDKENYTFLFFSDWIQYVFLFCIKLIQNVLFVTFFLRWIRVNVVTSDIFKDFFFVFGSVHFQRKLTNFIGIPVCNRWNWRKLKRNFREEHHVFSDSELKTQLSFLSRFFSSRLLFAMYKNCAEVSSIQYWD